MSCIRNKEQSSRLRTVLTDSARNGIFKYRDTAGSRPVGQPGQPAQLHADPTIKAMIAATARSRTPPAPATA